MEYMKGGNLADICLDMAGKLSEGFIKYTLYMTLKSISYLHSQHILWRSCKSDDVLCDGEGVIKIADFNLSAMKSK